MRAVLALAVLAVAVLVAGCSTSTGKGPTTTSQAGPTSSSAAAEAGVLTGQLTLLAPMKAIPVSLANAGHDRLAVTLVMTTNLPQNVMSVNVTGPGSPGESARTSPFLYVFPGANPTVSFGDPQPGSWTVNLRLNGGVLADYEVHWCADDAAHLGPTENKACHHVY